MLGMLQFLLIVLAGLAVTVTLEIQDCQKINLTIFCLNDTICANCSTEAFYNCSFANCPYNVSIQWNIHPSHRDVGSTLENETLEGPLELLISNFSTFDFENGNLGCFANSSAYRVLSESIPLQGLCQDRHRYHQASAKHNSLKYTVDIPRTYDIEGGVHLRVFPRDPSLPKLKESLSGARVTKFGSDILEVKVQTKQGEPLTDFPDEPVLLTFPVDPYDPSKEKPLCCFREELGYWSTHGCNTNIKSSDTVQCSCNHLTSFAILMQTSEVDVDDRILTILTKIGLSVSITCLILTLLIYALCRLKSLRIIIHANLAFALLVGHTVFLFIDTENKAGCAVVAVLLHFFFLAAFTWMALEGVFLLIKSTPTFPWRIRLPAWFAVGWGVPASVVLMSIASKFEGYNSRVQGCWLSFDSGFVWAFLAPVIVIIIVNTTILTRLIYIFLSLQANKKKSEAQKMKAGLRLVLILEPLLGLPWLSGLLYSSPNTTFFAYVFVICNSLQGMFLFVTQCLFDEEVRNKFKLMKSKRSSKVTSLTSSSGNREKTLKETLFSERSCKQDGFENVSDGVTMRRMDTPKHKLGTDTQHIHITENQDTPGEVDLPTVSRPNSHKSRCDGPVSTMLNPIKQLLSVRDKRNDFEMFEYVTSDYSIVKSNDSETRPYWTPEAMSTPSSAQNEPVDLPEKRPDIQGTDIANIEEPWQQRPIGDCFVVSKGNSQHIERGKGEAGKQQRPAKIWRY
ncbi:latrophilin-like protein LAT-2 isoform X2 [Acanthaster planci]|uniref:Latrophilin-like protein LAT-2 isoform X2 n=1 Tax=Acanthaster planci TaxID=133434 RepID=A0A8B7ZT88_ACAPL|nr:latrophilin-like protein LAT-2 isoform X2 [Acanthaster planci]